MGFWDTFDETRAAAQDYTQKTQDYAQKAKDNLRLNAARDALVKTYGAAAGDPTSWDQAQAAAESQAMQPGKVQAQTLTNQGTQQTNDDAALASRQKNTYSLIQLLKTKVGQDGSVDPQAFDQLTNNPAVQKLTGVTPEQAAEIKPILTGPGGAQHLDTIGNALLGPTKATGAMAFGTDDSGASVAIERDQFGRIVKTPLGGTTPTAVTTAQTGQANSAEHIKQDAYLRARGWTTAQIAAYRASTTANNSTYGAGDGQSLPSIPTDGAPPATGPSPAAMDALLARNGGKIDAAIQHAPDDATAMALGDYYEKKKGIGPQAAPATSQPTSALFDRLPPKGRQLAVGQAQHLVDQATNLRNTNAIIAQVQQQISPYTAGAGSPLSALPGTAQRNLRANLETLSAQGLTAWIQSLKNNQGQTGIGRVLQTEANAAMKIYGNMEQAQSAKQLAYHTKLFGYAVNQLYDHARRGYRAMYGADPEAALGMSAYQSGGTTAAHDFSHLWK